MVNMLMWSGGQWWICSCVEVANGEYAHVKKWSIEGYAQVQSWSLVDILMCRGGQWWICSGAGVVNCVYAQVQWWSMEGRIYSCVGVINGYMLICSNGQ